MRDDVPGLASLRMFPLNPTPSSTPLSRPPSTGRAEFANELKHATAARTLSSHPHARYASPLRQSTTRHTPTVVQTTPVFRPKTGTLTPATSATGRPPNTLGRASNTPAAQLSRAAWADGLDPTRSGTAWTLNQYPHPNGDNARGMHWIPTTKQSAIAVDRFVADAQRMGVRWVTFLNNGANVGDNDYLVSKLVGAGIEPVMRLYSPTLEPIQGDIEGMVRHYSAIGVHYFQPFNEPNLDAENPDGRVSVDRYLDAWMPAARAIVSGGGLPGFGSMAPGGDVDDQQFLKAALDGLKARGELHLLDRAWLSMHNYTWNHPIQDRGDGDGFFKFRAYHRIVREALGRDLPIVGTEGGSFAGEQEDPKMAVVTPDIAADWTQQAFRYVRDLREPWLFASSVWTIADMAGGGTDPRFEAQALFKADGSQSSIVGALQGLG
jgi:hypothetical protein